MLQQLYIHNFTLIDKLDIHFSSGFSVITGETGAGKSIILGAIGLLLGNRAEARLVKAGTDKCIVEAHFDISRYDMQQFFIDNDIDYEPDDCIMPTARVVPLSTTLPSRSPQLANLANSSSTSIANIKISCFRKTTSS